MKREDINETPYVKNDRRHQKRFEKNKKQAF